MLDLLFRGAAVVDGTGKPARVADVGVRDGRITAPERNESAKEIIDAGGLALMPGIVDEWAYKRASGTVERVETDTDRDGRVDKWEIFDESTTPGGAPTLREVAMDPDASGRPTRRLLYNARGEFERVEKQ